MHGNGKHLEYPFGSPTFFEWKMRRPSKSGVTNLFAEVGNRSFINSVNTTTAIF